MKDLNPLARAVRLLAPLPPTLRGRAITALFTRRVRFAGTGGVRFESLDAHDAVLTLACRRRVQNHIGTVHAAATALLAETASGAVFGLNLPSDRLPLLKCMHIDYLRRSSGALRAQATLTADDVAYITQSPRGERVIPVRITDAEGNEPVQCRMTWAWVPRHRD